MATARLPARDGAPRPGSKRQAGPIELVDTPRKPPKPPASVKGAARKMWNELYAEPIADLWRPIDSALVLRLILLRQRLEALGMEAPTGVYSAVQTLEDRLLLNPRARRVAGIVYVDPPTELAEAGKVRPLDARRRARMAAGT